MFYYFFIFKIKFFIFIYIFPFKRFDDSSDFDDISVYDDQDESHLKPLDQKRNTRMYYVFLSKSGFGQDMKGRGKRKYGVKGKMRNKYF